MQTFWKVKSGKGGGSTVGGPEAAARAPAKSKAGGPNPEKVRAQKDGAPKGGAQKGGGPKFRAFFFSLLPLEISLSVLSLGVFWWNIGGV